MEQHPDLPQWTLEDIQKGPGIDQIGSGEVTIRTMEIDNQMLKVSRYQGPFEELTWSDLVYIVLRGKLYDPASSHYELQFGSDAGTVYCDRCHLVVDKSIGIDNKDLCLSCVKYVRSNM